jgi:CMP-N-acetylneuraminic acid synthetase
MKIAIQIPIKARSSTRVPNKNFRDLNGKPLSCWLIDELIAHCPPDWDIFIDSEATSTFEFFKDRYHERIRFHLRHEWFACDQANGNHLIHQFAVHQPDYNLYAQIFVTAVTLKGELIREAIESLATSLDKHDSLFLVTEKTGWFWFKDKALNYNPSVPDGLPRSQDATVHQETTGLYAITRDAILRSGCRIGSNPILYNVPTRFGFDIDTVEDFQEAQRILNQ